jgi:hypothetical protein
MLRLEAFDEARQIMARGESLVLAEENLGLLDWAGRRYWLPPAWIECSVSSVQVQKVLSKP